MGIQYFVYIDWDNDGNFATTGDDITAYVRDLEIDSGIHEEMAYVAQVGTCHMMLNNENRRFTPKNATGPYYGKLTQGKPVLVQANDGSGLQTIFRGYTSQFQITAGSGPSRDNRLPSLPTVEIQCVDLMSKAQDYALAMPLFVGYRSDQLIRQIMNNVLSAPTATGSATFSGNPGNGDTITVNGNPYRFVNALTLANDVLIGADLAATARNLANAVNGGVGSGSTYHASTTRPLYVTASASGDAVAIPGGGSTLAIGAIGGTLSWWGQRFTPTYGGALAQLQVTLDVTVGAPTGTMTWEIRSDNAGAPGTILQSGTFAPVASSTNTISATGVTLSANTLYWLVLRPTSAQTGTNYWAWNGSTSSSYTVGTMSQSINSGSSWVNDPGYGANCAIAMLTVVAFTASLRGAIGNGYALAKSSAAITLSGANLTGGVDYPITPGIAYDVGKRTFDYAGDTWKSGQTNAFAALQDVVASEWGSLFFLQRDGTPTFKSQDYLLQAPSSAVNLTILGQNETAEVNSQQMPIFNRVEVEYVPGSALALGVLATAKSTITVPGQSGTERWNGTVVLPGGGNTVVELPFIDPTTGQPMGAISITPLVAGTDWTANEASDGSGPSYTGSPSLSFSIVQNASNVQISIKNIALGPLYLQTLQVRGIGFTRYQPNKVMREDANSQANYTNGSPKTLTVRLPFAYAGISNVADALTQYLLDKYKNPDYRVTELSFENSSNVNGVNLLSLGIGSLINFTDYQLAISGAKYLITGLKYRLRVGGGSTIGFVVRAIDTQTYWLLADTTYGVLGTTTRLGI